MSFLTEVSFSSGTIQRSGLLSGEAEIGVRFVRLVELVMGVELVWVVDGDQCERKSSWTTQGRGDDSKMSNSCRET